MASASSHASAAVTIGLRGNATATPVGEVEIDVGDRRRRGREVRRPTGLGDHESREPRVGRVLGELRELTQRRTAGHHVHLHASSSRSIKAPAASKSSRAAVVRSIAATARASGCHLLPTDTVDTADTHA